METLGQRVWISDPYCMNGGHKKTLHGYSRHRPGNHQTYKTTSRRKHQEHQNSWEDTTYEQHDSADDQGVYTHNIPNHINRKSWCLQQLDQYPLLAGYYHQYLTPFSHSPTNQLPQKAKLCATGFKDLEPDPENPGYRKKQITQNSKIGAYDYCNPGKHIMEPSMVKLAVSHVPRSKKDTGPKGLLEYRTHHVDETLTRMAVVKGDLLDLLAVQFNAREILRDVYSHVQGAKSDEVVPPRKIEFHSGKNRERGNRYMHPQNSHQIQNGNVLEEVYGKREYSNRPDRNRKHQVQNSEAKGRNEGSMVNNVKSRKHSMKSECSECGTVRSNREVSETNGDKYHSQEADHESDVVKSQRFSSKVLSDIEPQVSESGLEKDFGAKLDGSHITHRSIPSETSRHGYPSAELLSQSGDDRLSRNSLQHSNRFGEDTEDIRGHRKIIQSAPHTYSDISRHTKQSYGQTSDTESYVTAQSSLGSETRQKVFHSDTDIHGERHPVGSADVDCLHDMVKSGENLSNASPGQTLATNRSSDTLHSILKSTNSIGIVKSESKCSCSCHSHDESPKHSTSSLKDLSQRDTRYNGIYATDVYDGVLSNTENTYNRSRNLRNDVTVHQRNTNTVLYQPLNGSREHYTSNLWYPPVPGTVDDPRQADQVLQSQSARVFPMNSTPRGISHHSLHSRSHCGGTSPCCDYHTKVNSSRSLVPYGMGGSSTTTSSCETDVIRTKAKQRAERKYRAYDLDLDSSALTLDDLVRDNVPPTASYLSRLALYGLHGEVKPAALPVTEIWDQRHMGRRSWTSSSLHSALTPQGHSTTDDDCTYGRNRGTVTKSHMTENLHAYIMPITHKSSGKGSPYTSPTYQSSRVSLATAGSVSEMSQSAGTYKRKESKPTFIIKPRRCFADEGGLGKFKASFDGEPAPSLQWQRDGVPLNAGDKYRMFTDDDFHYLEIQDVQKDDKGTFSCVITNSLGSATMSAELEVYAVRRRAEPSVPSVLSTAKKFSAPSNSANLSKPASVFTTQVPESSRESLSLKAVRQRAISNENPPNTTTNTSLSSTQIRESTKDQQMRSYRLHDGQKGRMTNGSMKSTQESVVSKVASKFGQDSTKSKSSVESRSDRTLSSSNTSTLKATEPEKLQAYEPVRSKAWGEKTVKEDENKNNMSAITTDVSGSMGHDKNEESKPDVHITGRLPSDNKDVYSSTVTTKTSLGTMSALNSGGRRHLDNNVSAKEDVGLKSHVNSVTTPGKTYSSASDRLSSVKSKFEEKSVKSENTNEKPPLSGPSLTSQHSGISSLSKQTDEPLTSNRKAKSSKLRSLSKKFAEFEENDQEFFSPSKPKSTKDKESYSISMSTGKEDDTKVSDELEKESIGSSVLSTEDSASVEEKVEEVPVSAVQEETKSEEVQEVQSRVEETKPHDTVEEKAVEHAPVKQQVKETKKTTVVKSPNASKTGETRPFSAGRKSTDLKSSGTKSHETKSSYGTTKASDARLSSVNKGPTSRLSKTSQESTKASSRISPESSSAKFSRVSPESNKTTSRSKALGQSDASKTSVRNRYQPQTSPATKRIGSATQDSKTASSASSPTKRTTPGLRSGTPSSAKGGSSTENLTGRRAVGTKVPEVSSGLTDKEARDGEYVSLKCSFTGTPTPTVAWYCNGAILKDSTEIKQQFDGQWATLKFKDVFPDDTGRYEAVATNKAGEARTACLLTVKEAKPPKIAPSFTRPLQDQAVNDGDSLELSCEYTGNPEPELTWYHEDKVLEPCKDFTVSSENGVACLKIAEVFPEDAGLYEVVAINEKGETKTVANLTVNEPTPEVDQKGAEPVTEVEKPSFTQGLQNMVVYDGQKLTLQVEVAGTLPIEVCWVHGKKEISADDNEYQVLSEGRVHKLIIPDVLPEDEGVWLCEAYNNYGDVDTSCKLTVRGVSEKSATSSSTFESHSREEFDEEAISRDKNILAERKGKIRNENLNQPPKFILKPKSLTTDEGNSAKFVCEVIGNPAPRVMWKRDGVELNNAGRFKSWHDGWKHYFEITHTLVTDAGKYQCVAKSNQGEISCNIDLVVSKLDSPAEISDFRSLLKSRPQLGRIGTKSSTASESEAEQLDFRGVLTRHVKTKSKPKFLKELHDVKCKEGEAVTLTCRIMGTPVPIITWLQGQKEIKESRFFKMSFDNEVASLHIAGVYPEDQGEYLCVAENEAGVAESLCDIDIDYSTNNTPRAMGSEPSSHQPVMEDLEPPFIEELSPENVSVQAGKSFTLSGKFLGSQPLNVQWTRGKRVIETGDRFRIETTPSTSFLTVTDCKCGDTGIYTLSLSSTNGSDSITASVTIQDPEEHSDKPECPVGQPVVSHITAQSLSLAWSGPSYDGGSQVTHYKVESKVNGTDNWTMLTNDCKHTSYHVTGLESNQEYVFRVSAANKHGFGESGQESNPVITIDRRPSLQAQEIQHANEAHADETVDEYSLSSPLSPLALLAAQNQLTMEPRFVEVSKEKFSDFYDIGEEIGKGRFGNVFTCREKSSGIQLAAKKIRVKGSQKEEVVGEVEIMNELHHPKLLLLYDAFMASREMILVMEHVAGGELFERIIDEDYELTEREAIHFMRQICEGVRFMHEKNILHLDLKPENILCITPNSNEVKIIDFGLARKFDPKNPTKVLFGTPEFVAPEVINYDQIGFETDMWSLGVICYLLLSGLSPFLGDSEAETLANVTMATWDFDEDFDEISDESKKFISLLLVKDMSKRMKVNRALRHPWLSQDVTYMKAKRLSTQKHKHFMARRKWQKTGNAIRALGRMSNLQKAFSHQSSDVSTISNSTRSRNSSFASEASSVIEQPSFKNQITLLETIHHVNGKTDTEEIDPRSPQDINSNELAKSSSQNIVPLTNEDTSQDITSAVLNSQDDPNASLDKYNVNFITPMKDFEVYEGDSARFDVLLENFDERFLKISWFKEEQELAQNRKFRMTQNGSGKCGLIIRNCDLDDDARYSCKVVSGSDVQVESSAELYVESLYSTSTHS